MDKIQEKNMKFTLHYEDGTSYEGNSLDGSWKNAPQKIVEKLIYEFNDKKIVFEGFSEYNHLVENVEKVGSQIKLRENIFIMGRNKTQTAVLWFNIPNNKIVRAIAVVGKEVAYIERELGRMTIKFREGQLSGWMEGFYTKPKIYLG